MIAATFLTRSEAASRERLQLAGSVSMWAGQ
jgi:hypothetical protein